MDGNLTASDVALLTGNNRNDGMFGGDGAWWLIVLFLFVFCGWGNNGWGNNGNGGGYAATAATQADIQRGFDNSAVISKLDGINSGLCDGFYAVNNGMLTGFNGINTNIMQTGFGIQQAINADTVANMQNTSALQAQLANCCCETREAIQSVNYNMAQNTCALQNTMNSNTRDIIDSQNAGARAILDYLCNEKISNLQAENNDLRRAASQDRQSYRSGKSEDCKRKMLAALEEHLDELTTEMSDMSKDAECREERDLVKRYVEKLRDML